MRTVLAAVALALCIPALAHADQCAVVDKKVAADALALAKSSGTALEMCEPCGDKAPGKAFATSGITSKGDRLVLGTKTIDLAYTYVKTGPKEWKNLATAVGCAAEGVSEYVRDGKPSGAAKRLPFSSSRPPPSMPPMPPSQPRATSADELVGSWTVRVTTWLTSCPARPSKGDESWDVDLSAGSYTIRTSENLVFEGAPAPLTNGMFTHSLHTKQLPSSTVLKLTHSTKDRFYGTIVRGEPAGGGSDPICVFQQNVSGQRKP
jgi:hypothetical protein